eukprot:c15836_g1_i2 orf=1-2961(-)
MEIMEASTSEVNPYIDSSVGALVWVRRRNGSWWPGRILAPEELPGAHLRSPRIGTPVKLLGREDGSVDWYNIEKSRRVKAFRCGEFDECIEKARSLASVLSKKREKYARREDAILHALELEKEHVEQTNLQENIFSLGQNYEQLSDSLNGGKLLHSNMNSINFQRSFMGPDASTDVAEASSDGLFSLHGYRKFSDVEWEDDIAETLPRMRGLQDLGLEMAPLKEQKASWSSVYKQFSHASMVEERKRAASSIVKSTVASKAPNSCITLKKKRSAQLDPMEDESLYKKRARHKCTTGPTDNNSKLGNGAFDSGSKASFLPFIMNTGRNGHASFLHPKQEKKVDLLDRVPFESKPSKGWSGSEGWEALHIESRCRHEMFNFSSFMDKAFSDHPKENCCSGLPYLYGGSQMEVTSLAGSAFFDSLLQGGPASRCSFLPGAAYAGSFTSEPGNEVERANSFSLLGSLSAPPLTFQTWPSYSHSELIAEKLMHEPGSRGQIASIYPTCIPEYPFERSNASAVCSVYNNRLQDRAIFDQRRMHAGEVPLSSGHDLDANSIKPSRQCLSSVAEEDAREGAFTLEDEADSFQQIPGSSLSSPEAIDVSTANGQTASLEDKSSCLKVLGNTASENSSLNHYDPCGLKESKTASVNHGFVNTGGHLSEGCDDELGIGGAVKWGSSPEECDKVHGQSFSKWQVKGRRLARARAHCKTLWGSAPGGVLDLRVENVKEVHVAASDVKCLDRCSRRPRHTFVLDSSSEDQEELFMNTSKPTQCVRKVGTEHAMKVRLPQVSGIHIRVSTYWVDVPIEFGDATLRGDHMTLVTIMSELIGKPIVGHSVLVVKIENRNREGQTDLRKNALSRKIASIPPLQPAWRTARRTAMQRIPRARGIILSLDHAQEASEKQQLTNLSKGQNRVMRKNDSRFGFSCTERRRHQKKSGLFLQKTRMLSSLAVQYGDKSTEHVSLKVFDTPLVTCIPVNVIFNRIREVLYRG